jgi:hypothetical protein
MTPEEKIQRGHAAEQLLANPLLDDAFSGIEQGLMKAFLEPPRESNSEMREGIYFQLQALRKLRDALTKYVRDGKFEAVTIQKRDEAVARARAVSDAGSGTA